MILIVPPIRFKRICAGFGREPSASERRLTIAIYGHPVWLPFAKVSLRPLSFVFWN